MCVVSTEGMKLGWKRVLSVQPGLTLVMTIIPGLVKTSCRLVPTMLKPPEITQTLVLGVSLWWL